MWKIIALVISVALFSTGCFQPATKVSVPRDTAQQCHNHCTGLGMRLSAVVIIMSSAGCVCERGQAASTARIGAAAIAGAAMIQAVQQQQQQRSGQR